MHALVIKCTGFGGLSKQVLVTELSPIPQEVLCNLCNLILSKKQNRTDAYKSL